MIARTGRWRRSRRGLRGLLASGAIAWLFAIGAPVIHADDHEVTITEAGFDPATVTVSTGEAVTWTNQTTSERAVVSDDGTLNSGPMGRGEAFGHVFEAPGTVTYYEAGNPAFRAMIVVEARLTAAARDPVPPASPQTSGMADSPALFLAVLVVSVIAIGAAATTLIAASRRPDR